MALVTEESILSNIKKPNPTPEKPTPKITGVNYFTDTNADGFILNKTTGDSTDFKIKSPITSTLAKQTADNKYVNITVDSEKSPSPIEIKHSQDDFLNNLYEQSKGSGRLGLRKSSRFFTEPFVIRDIGDRWGVFNISRR